MALENFESLLLKLGEVIGLPELQADANGDCELVFDGETRIHIQWEPLEDTIVFSSDIGVVPKGEKRLAFLEKLLSANLFWLGTNGGTFAIESQSDLVVLQNRTRLDSLTYDMFSRILENFVDSTENWTKELREDTVAAEGGAASALDPALIPGTTLPDPLLPQVAGEGVDEHFDVTMPPGGLRNLV